MFKMYYFPSPGFIVKKLNVTLRCESCLEAVEGSMEDNRTKLLAVKDRGGLISPNKDVVEICELCEKIFRRNEKN